jgi:hypothetical protein
MRQFWKEFNGHLEVFHTRMAGLYRSSDLRPDQMDHIIDLMIDELMKELTQTRKLHSHKALPNIITRKAIIG